MYYDLNEVYGDNAQLGGNRNRCEGDVDMRSGKTIYGDHARVSGTQYDRKSNKTKQYPICLINAPLTFIVKPPRKSIIALPCPTYG